MDLLSPAKDGISLDAELTVGDKEETIETNIGSHRSTQSATTINNVQDIPLSYVLLFTILAGWAIPDPKVMGMGLLTLLRTLLPWAGRRK